MLAVATCLICLRTPPAQKAPVRERIQIVVQIFVAYASARTQLRDRITPLPYLEVSEILGGDSFAAREAEPYIDAIGFTMSPEYRPKAPEAGMFQIKGWPAKEMRTVGCSYTVAGQELIWIDIDGICGVFRLTQGDFLANATRHEIQNHVKLIARNVLAYPYEEPVVTLRSMIGGSSFYRSDFWDGTIGHGGALSFPKVDPAWHDTILFWTDGCSIFFLLGPDKRLPPFH